MYDVDSSAGRPRPHLLYAELRGDRSSPLVAIVDAGEDALELGGAEGPGENQVAGLLGKAVQLGFRSHGTDELEVIPVQRLRSDEARDPQARLPLRDHEHVVGMLRIRQRQRADELPDVVLLFIGTLPLPDTEHTHHMFVVTEG